MKIQDIKTPDFITEPRLMGEQTDEGIGNIHYSCEVLNEVTKANYYKSAKGDLYYRAGDNWYVLNNGRYQSCDPPFQTFD